MRRASAAMLAVCAMALSACTSASPEAIAENDPFEPMNRAVYRFDERFDKYVVLPVAGVYVYHTPAPIHHGLHNFLINLDSSVTFVNDVLQGRISNAGETLARFTMNTTVGIGGLIDVATPAGIPFHASDFGQTLGRYGVPEGPFLVLPIIGPDPPRDLGGDGVDLFLDPLFYVPPGASVLDRLALTAGLRTLSPFEVHARNIVLRQELERGSVDPYVTMRSVYRQLRDEEIRDGEPGKDGRPPAK
ncbi:MAG TPA: VacJ family lipoprotein [Rhizomicrobium sp.]|nr:VacJ family lipoprotein [Rhizomicrobium sp.]